MSTSVLVIEGDPRVTDLLSAILKPHGFTVSSANNLEAGIARIQADPPQIVLFDLMSSRGDGVQFCRDIRQFSDVPIIVVSPLDGPSVVATILDAGADDCLVKPVPTAVLVAHLNKLARRTGSLGCTPTTWRPGTEPLPS